MYAIRNAQGQYFTAFVPISGGSKYRAMFSDCKMHLFFSYEEYKKTLDDLSKYAPGVYDVCEILIGKTWPYTAS